MSKGIRTHSRAWWGPPRKFDPNVEERKISWLELFYDLVYVIAISKITHHLGTHFGPAGFWEYSCFFCLIFWGWLNGSLYHDLHGNAGLRTRLMTLWQVMIIAAISVTISPSQAGTFNFNTAAFMIMQLYITYMWWSVGIYDKEHRRYNVFYTVLYLFAFALLGLSLFLPQNALRFILPLVILFNYLPPFITQNKLRRSSLELSLSSSMSERLGLFTIIVLGEVVLGVVNGIGQLATLDLVAWLKFALSLAVVFILWWLFFTLTSNRDAKKGFINASLLQLLYIPTLMSLGLIATIFTQLFEKGNGDAATLTVIFSYALAAFMAGIGIMMGLLVYPATFDPMRRRTRGSLFITAAVFLVIAVAGLHIPVVYFLLIAILVLCIEIIYLNSLYYKLTGATNEATAAG